MKKSVLPWKMSVQPTGWLNAEWKLEEKGEKKGGGVVIFFPSYLSCLVNVIGNMWPDCTCARWILQSVAPSSQRELNKTRYNEVKTVFEERGSGAGSCFRNWRRTRHLLGGGMVFHLFIYFSLTSYKALWAIAAILNAIFFFFFLWEESGNLT